MPPPPTSTPAAPLPPGGPTLGTWRFFRLMLWVHSRTALAQFRAVRQRSPFLLALLGAFILGYLGLGYWLFRSGLEYLQGFPLVGMLLSQRIVHLIFLSFFAMLIVSNLIIGYATLMRNRETTWLLTLPIRQRDVYRWKFVEGLAVSSWALLFLSAPMMLAYGQAHQLPPSFYGKVALACLPFVVIPGVLGSGLLLLSTRLLANRWVRRGFATLAAGAGALLIYGLVTKTAPDADTALEVLSFERLLSHTRLSQHLLLPSSWMAQLVLSLTDSLTRQGWFYFLLLLSNALMGLLLAFTLADRSFFTCWSRALDTRAERAHRNAEEKRRRLTLTNPFELIPCLPRPMAALLAKDARLFRRDPAQWTQFLIFFGLLCIYVINLRSVSFTVDSHYWETLLSYLNLTASALTLSTLTTRFVFPQFSLEGRRLWILGLTPLGLRRVLLLKFWSSFIVSGLLTVGLMIASSLVLGLPAERIAFFALAIAVLSASLTGLAVGLGALFPNLREENPSRIVSGFGGTLCLAISFLYIAAFVALCAVPAMKDAFEITVPIPPMLALGLALVLSGCVGAIPLGLALRRLKTMDGFH